MEEGGSSMLVWLLTAFIVWFKRQNDDQVIFPYFPRTLARLLNSGRRKPCTSSTSTTTKRNAVQGNYTQNFHVVRQQVDHDPSKY